ncbi:uncharacterized protein LOC130796292 [Actinidia eriantha]|uniref:uncharacterized protein LOC130796292 n=1 Tax=Actinidia eriantha TaxID=165200 RepID=UPI00258EB306|nr:uncharacterized protein LOC130796292 [Actinidia eriantha]
MARRLLRPLRRTLLSPLSSVDKTLILQTQPSLSLQTRAYISEMRKSTFEGNLLRLLRNEIHYELDHSPPSQPASEFNSFTVDERQGEQWIRLSRKFGENEEVKVEVTIFDGSLPVKKPRKIGTEEESTLHITLIVSAWPESIEIQKIFMRGRDQMAGQPYMGPGFK